MLALHALCLLLTGVPAGSDTTWHSLDREIEALSNQLEPSPGEGLQVGLLIRSSYEHSSDDAFMAPGGEDLGGFRMQDAILWVEGTTGDFDLRIELDAADATGWPPIAGDGIMPATLRDAYALWNITEEWHLYMGNFKCPVLRSSTMDQDVLLFVDRTRLGQLFDVWQPGAAVTFDSGPFHAKLAVQNGFDGVADEYGITARVEYHLEGGAVEQEGALDNEGTRATFGLAYFQDESQVMGEDFGSAIVFDAYAAMGAGSLHAEIVDMDEELASRALANTSDDATPWSLTGGWLLTPEWEAAVRYQDLDDENDTTSIGAGVNRYIVGHNAKWQLNVSQYEDDPNDDGLIVQLGLTVGDLR